MVVLVDIEWPAARSMRFSSSALLFKTRINFAIVTTDQISTIEFETQRTTTSKEISLLLPSLYQY
jgi:hypothetical protein